MGVYKQVQVQNQQRQNNKAKTRMNFECTLHIILFLWSSF